MNILDENILKDERQLLQRWRVAIHQIGYDVGRKGMQDEEIIPFLHQLPRPTFFTRDEDFYERSLCHPRYCLVFLDVAQYEVAVFVRRVLRYREFNTQIKRMGAVIRAAHVGVSVWRSHAEQEIRFEWVG